jgi:ribulose-phosphate 3-epimerase
MKILAPSILSADFSCLARQVRDAEKGGAKWIHCDIMDGHFVPNISYGPMIVKTVRSITKLPLDVHLMIENPDAYIPAFAKAGADYITVHQEAVKHLNRTINFIKENGAKAGVALNPATPLLAVSEIADMLDLMLIMSVNPGFGGQSFIESSIKKIKSAALLRNNIAADFLIEVDGGINEDTAHNVATAGCDVFVAGSSVFSSKLNIADSAANLIEIINR